MNAHNKKSNFARNFRNYFREYCSSTSIHGFRYFGEKRTVFERIWWIFVFCITLSTCGYFIHEVYLKWKSSPVIVSFATRETSIYSIPFPAVTICPEAKSDRTYFNYSEVFRKRMGNKNLTEEENKIFGYMNMLCDIREVSLGNSQNLSLAEYVSEDFFEIIAEVNTFEVEHLFYCEFMGNPIPCVSIFKHIVTDEGICVTFNMLSLKEIYKDDVWFFEMPVTVHEEKNSRWSVQDGYVKKAGIDTFPRRALFSGTQNALNVYLLTSKTDGDPLCKKGFFGYRVLIHTPMRIPLSSQNYFRIPLNQELLGSMQPVMMETSQRIKMYDPKLRECYFPLEKNLTYFKIYTQANCKLEFLTKYTLEQCGCVNFFMPRINGTKICGEAKKSCIRDAENHFQTMNLEEQLKEGTDNNPKKSDQGDCLPTCTDISYEVQTSQTEWNWAEVFEAMNLNETLPMAEAVSFSKLTLFFKYPQFVTFKRQELYGPTDFLANFGGLLGLFTGFSALSLMEIIYFASVRIICNEKLYGFWSGPDNN